MNWKIYHPNGKEIIAELRDRVVILHRRELEKALRLTGITIPADLRSQYNDKQIIYPEDPLFPRAFKEIFYPNCLRETGMVLSEN